MSQSSSKSKASGARKQKSGGEEGSSKEKPDNFFWTDDEVQLLLKVTGEYKANKEMENIDWESVQTKYSDILQILMDQLPNSPDEGKKIGKDYPHKKEEITKATLTSKLKSIRRKFRQAVDSKRRSGHGRVVLLYFDDCERIWGGSPATVQINSGIESFDLTDAGIDSQILRDITSLPRRSKPGQNLSPMDLPQGPDTVADLEFTENSEESSGKKTGNEAQAQSFVFSKKNLNILLLLLYRFQKGPFSSVYTRPESPKTISFSNFSTLESVFKFFRSHRK